MAFRFFNRKDSEHDDGSVAVLEQQEKVFKEVKAFNFQDWLAKMRSPDAFDLVKPLKKFLDGFTVEPLSLADSIDHVRKFLDETSRQLNASALFELEDDDFANEGMEKYLMNKIYKHCFRPPNSDDECQDQALHDRISLLSFLQAEHFDISPACMKQDEEFEKAKKELIRMDSYKAPRDKMICIMNCCRIINNILIKAHQEENKTGADEFIPLLIYVILCSNPPALLSNLLYIQRFRHPEKLLSEPGYYFTNVLSAVQFIQNMDARALTIDPHYFEQALTMAAEAHAQAAPPPPPLASTPLLVDIPGHVVETPTIECGSLASSLTASTLSTSAFATSALTHHQSTMLVDLPPAEPITPRPVVPTVAPPLSAITTAPPSPPIVQMLQESAHGAIDKYLTCSVDDLTMRDIPVLLRDYQRLSRLVDRMAKTLQLNASEF